MKNHNITNFLNAARVGDLPKIQQYIETGNYDQDQKDLALKIAFESKHYEVCKYLVKQGAEMEEPLYSSAEFWTAAAEGDLDKVQQCMEAGLGKYKDAALSFGAQNGHLHIVRYLIDEGASLGTRSDSILLRTMREGHFDMADFLIEHGVDINSLKERAFIDAARFSNYPMLRYLFEKGVDPNLDLSKAPEEVRDWIKQYSNSSNLNSKLQNTLAEKPDKINSDDGKL